MFEVAELGRRVDKATFKRQSTELRTRLVAAQQRLRRTPIPVVVIVSGVEGAGKTEVVNRFSEWLDTRGLQTHSFWEESDEERARPRFWRFWRRLPPRGSIGVMFGSWYTRPIVAHASGDTTRPEFDARLAHIARFERLLAQDGALIVKLWFHLSKGALHARIAEDDHRGSWGDDLAPGAATVGDLAAHGPSGALPAAGALAANPAPKASEAREAQVSGAVAAETGAPPSATKGKRPKRTKRDKKRDKKRNKRRSSERAGDVGRGVQRWRVSPLARQFAGHYDAFAAASERAIRATDSGASRWHVIESTDRNYRDLSAARVLLDALERRLDLAESAVDARALASAEVREPAGAEAAAVAEAPADAPRASQVAASPPQPASQVAASPPQPASQVAASPTPTSAEPPAVVDPSGVDLLDSVDAHQPSILDRVDLSATVSRKAYKRRLAEAQRHLHALTWEAWRLKVPTVCVFEGWDASGKGGAIRRLTAGIDARLFRTVPIAAPTDEEQAQHYLWRFWRQLPPDGRVRIYDRSWYGRVLVERVEGFCTPEEWARAYQEINDFEEDLANHGTALAKFWLHISPEEQLRRFREREVTPYKQHKITGEDWRNRDQWGRYEAAVNDMVARTSTSAAPWTLVAGDDKKVARLTVVETVCARLEDALRAAATRGEG